MVWILVAAAVVYAIIGGAVYRVLSEAWLKDTPHYERDWALTAAALVATFWAPVLVGLIAYSIVRAVGWIGWRLARPRPPRAAKPADLPKARIV